MTASYRVRTELRFAVMMALPTLLLTLLVIRPVAAQEPDPRYWRLLAIQLIIPILKMIHHWF